MIMVITGSNAPASGAARDFLVRNGVPHQWLDLETHPLAKFCDLGRRLAGCLSLAKTRSRRLNQRISRSARPIMAVIEHADDHHVAGATELSMSARSQHGRRQDRNASADC